MAARRCSRCSLDWPTDQKFVQCPGCGEDTWWCNDADHVGPAAAKRQLKLLEFDRYYEERGPRPAALPVALEQSIAEIQALNAIPVAGEELPVDMPPAEQFGSERDLLRGGD